MKLYIETHADNGDRQIRLGYYKKPTPYNSRGKAYLAAGVTVILAVWALYATSVPLEAMP